MQQQLKDMFPPATQQQLMTKSTFPHEEVVKLWILNDGTMLWAEYAHFEMLFKIKVFGYDQAKATGMIRVSSDIDNGELHLDFKKKPTQQQILALQEIAKLHDSTSLWIDEEGDSIPLRSPSDLSAYFRGEKVRAPSLAAQFHESLQEELSYKEQLADAIMRGRVWRVLRDDFSINVELEHMKVIGSYYKKERAKDIDILVTLTSEDFKKLIGKIAYFGDFAGYLIDVFITDGKHNGVGVQINKMGHVKFKQLKKGTYNEFL
jgi:predicted nucleotidyltransferase